VAEAQALSNTGPTAHTQVALDFHREATVFLGYMNPVARYGPEGPHHALFLEDDPSTQGALPQLRRGGVDAGVVSFGVPTIRFNSPAAGVGASSAVRPVLDGPAGVRYVRRCLDDFRDALGVSTEAGIAASSTEIDALNARGKTALLLHLTGAWCNCDPDNLNEYYRCGVRAIHLCIEGLSKVGVSSGDAVADGGLTGFGREAVREMNRLGMVVDIAHAADETARQILEASNRPVISSHTWCRALRPGVRGLPDELIRAVASSGGVVGLFLVADPLDANPPRGEKFQVEFSRRIDDLWQRYGHDANEFLMHRYNWDTWKDLPGVSNDPALQPAMTGVETVLRHIDHAVAVAGIDHVGIGPDYEMGVMIPRGLETAAQLPALTAALLHHGYSCEDTAKILGGNFMRVYREIM